MTRSPAPGQRARDDFPRFGLPPYATRFPERPADTRLIVTLPDGTSTESIDLRTSALEHVDQVSDLHCVTTWSHRGIPWRGVRLRELIEEIVSRAEIAAPIRGAIFEAQDGYRTSLVAEDLLSDDVIVAYAMNGAPIPVAHGAPLRLVAPAHYGYKNLKHLARIRLCAEQPDIKRGLRRMLDHPRARVAREERGRYLPGWLLRIVYRLFIPGTVRRFSDALAEHEARRGPSHDPE